MINHYTSSKSLLNCIFQLQIESDEALWEFDDAIPKWLLKSFEQYHRLAENPELHGDKYVFPWIGLA